jgi:hypothetical protein
MSPPALTRIIPWMSGNSRDEAATLLDRSKEDWGVLREDYPGITRATRADDFIVAPAGQRYRCTGE